MKIQPVAGKLAAWKGSLSIKGPLQLYSTTNDWQSRIWDVELS